MKNFISYLTVSFCIVLMMSCNNRSPQRDLFAYAMNNGIVTECQLHSFPEWDGKPKLADNEEVIVLVQDQQAKLCYKDIPKIKDIPLGTDVCIINLISGEVIQVLACIPADQLEAGKKNFSAIKGYFTTDNERIKTILKDVNPRYK